MVPHVPVHICQAAVIRLVLYDGVTSDAVTILILVLAVTQAVGLFGALCAQGRLAQVVDGNWRP